MRSPAACPRRRLGQQDVRIWRAQTTLGDDPYAEICLSFLNDLNSYPFFKVTELKKLSSAPPLLNVRAPRGCGMPLLDSNRLECEEERELLRRGVLGFAEGAGALRAAVAVEFLAGRHGEAACSHGS